MKRLGNIVLAVAVCGLSRFGFGQVTLTEIAQTGDPVPGTGGTFNSFEAPVTDREDEGLYNAKAEVFSFQATSSNGNSGIYGYASQPGYPTEFAVTADTTMAAPSGGNYASFSDISEGYNEFGFIATTTTGTQLVMETDEDSPYTFSVVAETGQSPAPGKTFGDFQSISLMGDHSFVSFTAEGEIDTDIGIYDFTRTYSGNYPNMTVTQRATIYLTNLQ